MRKNNVIKPVRPCTAPSSNYCFRALQQCNLKPNMHKFNTFRVKNILENVKFYHFVQNDIRPKKVYDRLILTIPPEVTPSLSRTSSGQSEKGNGEQLSTTESESGQYSAHNQAMFDAVLIERQHHGCNLFMEAEEDRLTRLMTKRDRLLQDLYMIEFDVIGEALKSLKPGRCRDIPMSPGKPYEVSLNTADSDVEDDFGEQGLSDILMKDSRTSPTKVSKELTPPLRNQALKGSILM